MNGCLFKHESNKNDLSWGLNKQGGRSGTVDTVRSVLCLSVISEFVSLVLSHVFSLVLSSCFLVPAMCFPMFVCLCHVPSCCGPCLHPSPVPNLPGCVYHWFHLCPVNSPCLVHLCLCLPRLDCSHLSLVICCLCVYIVLVFLFLVVSS